MNLFHYTGEDALTNILNTNSLRATVSTQSNDELDTIYLRNILETESEPIIEQIIQSTPELSNNPTYAKSLIYNVLINKFKEACNDRLTKFNHTAQYDKCCVICFTTRYDSRFLWAAYTHNQGACLKFDKDELIRFSKTLTPTLIDNPPFATLRQFNLNMEKKFTHLKFDKVLYDPQEQTNKVKDILNNSFSKCHINLDELSSISFIYQPTIDFSFNNSITRTPLEPMQITIRQWIINFINETIYQLMELAPFIKHPYWKEEEEWRLVLYRPFYSKGLSHFFHYKNRGKDCNYINLAFDKSLIKEIIIGPHSNHTSQQLDTYATQGYNFSVIHSSGKDVLRE